MLKLKKYDQTNFATEIWQGNQLFTSLLFRTILTNNWVYLKTLFLENKKLGISKILTIDT
jgi:hypothetical protein